MKKRTLRIGIIGAGANTRLRHIPGFRAIEGIELARVVNRSRASSEKAAAEFGIRSVADHWREVAEAPDIDAVMIGTWPYLHAEVTIAALEAGKHVLTEARMAGNAAEAERMLVTAEKHPDLVAQIVPAPMSLDVDDTVRGWIAGGELGEIREVCVTQTGGLYADPSAPLTWRQDSDLSGKNMLTLGIYHEMVLRWMRDDPAVVAADGAVFTPMRKDPETGRDKPVAIPESVSVLGRFPDGARLVYHFSGVESGSPRNDLRVNGSRASVRFDAGAEKLFRTPVGGMEEEVAIPPEVRRGWRVEEDFIASIREGKPVELTDFETGLRYMRFTEAVWERMPVIGCQLSDTWQQITDNR